MFFSMVSDNAAQADAGGIFNNSATLTIAKSGITGNRAAGFVGGLFNTLGAVATVTRSIRERECRRLRRWGHPQRGDILSE